MTLPGLNAKHIEDIQSAIHASGQTVTVQDVPGGRAIKAYWRMLSAAELANCAELYVCRVTVSADDFPADKPPRKGLVLNVNGTRRGVMEVLEHRPSDSLAYYTLGTR
jgi:hypothetical protein